MPIPNWPTPTDDSGTGTDGTPVDQAWSNDVEAALSDIIYSITNPTVPPADTTDEVITARDIFDTLDQRLDNIDNQISGISVAPGSSSLAASENVAKNADLLSWSDGGALAPDQFVLSGGGAAIERTGPGEADPTNVGAGFASAKITFGAASALLTQTVISAADFAAQGSLAFHGRSLSVTVEAITSIVSQARVVVDDGVTTTASDFHTGSGLVEALTVTHALSSSATKVEFYLEVAQAGAAYFAGVIATWSDSAAPSWSPPPLLDRRILKVDITQKGNVGAPETDMMTYKIAPNLLHENGVVMHWLISGKTATNGAGKVVIFYFGSTSITLFSGAYNNKAWTFDIYVARQSAGNQFMWVTGGISTASVTLENATPTEDETAEIFVRVTGNATNDDDIIQRLMITEKMEAV